MVANSMGMPHETAVQDLARDNGWREVLRTALRHPSLFSHDEGAAQHPLAVILFLLDGLAILKILRHTSLTGKSGQLEFEEHDIVHHSILYIQKLVRPI